MALPCWLPWAVLCWGLCWANPLWESTEQDKILFCIAKPLPRNTGTVSEETQSSVCKTLASPRSQTEFSFVCSVLAPSWHSVPGDTTTARLKTPQIAVEESPSAYQWKSSSKYNIMLSSTLCLLSVFSPCARSSWSLCYDCDIGTDKSGKFFTHTHTYTHAPSKPDIRYLEINSVKRFGKVTVHAKTFKRHLGSSKSLNSFPF